MATVNYSKDAEVVKEEEFYLTEEEKQEGKKESFLGSKELRAWAKMPQPQL